MTSPHPEEGRSPDKAAAALTVEAAVIPLEKRTLHQFCSLLSTVPLEPADLELGILWWHAVNHPAAALSAWRLSRIITGSRLGNPNRERMERRLNGSPFTLKGRDGFQLKAAAVSVVRARLVERLGHFEPIVEQEQGFLPAALWRHTRGYIERVCVQLNGCYQYTFYDGAAVLVRRLTETLIIEAYEHLHREAEIKDSNGNYLMLADLVERALSPSGVSLGREAKAALRQIKVLGDRSAHNRRFNAVKADMDQVKEGVRVVADDLINLATLRRSKHGDV